MNATTALAIPPLSQSLQTKMACPHLYHASEITKAPDHDTVFSIRGTQIHEVVKTYIKHLVNSRQPIDLGRFDELIAAPELGEEAGEILGKVRDSLTIDPERVLAVEQRLHLSHDLLPVYDDDLYDCNGGIPVAFAGTPDLLTNPDPATVIIDDWKSYIALCDPDTFQARFYSLLVFQHYPDVHAVVFRLQFVRYGVTREIEFTREKDLPGLRKMALATRSRQTALHSIVIDETTPAIPGSHCVYCPLLTSTCPIKGSNPYAEQTPQQRLAFSVWARQALRTNDAVLRDFAKAEPIGYQDANGVAYRAAYELTEKARYPLTETAPVIDYWKRSYGEDLAPKLFVGSTELKSLARAKMRSALWNMLEAAKITKQDTTFAVGKVGEEEEPEQ